MLNETEAEVSGVIIGKLAADGQVVEVGTKLFSVRVG
jgi:biotin carboxyl carrier protein